MPVAASERPQTGKNKSNEEVEVSQCVPRAAVFCMCAIMAAAVLASSGSGAVLCLAVTAAGLPLSCCCSHLDAEL